MCLPCTKAERSFCISLNRKIMSTTYSRQRLSQSCNLKRFTILIIAAGTFSACGGGASTSPSSSNAPVIPDVKPSSGTGSATISVVKLQWAIPTPIIITLKDANGAAITAPLNCVSADSTALQVSGDCSSAKVNRIGNYTIKVSSGTVSASVNVTGIPQRQPIGLTSRAGGNGDGHAFAVVPASGTPWFWGDNIHYALAQAQATPQSSGLPIQGKLTPGTVMQNIVAVSIGETSALALTESGQVLSWGANPNNQLGRVAINGDPLPLPVRSANDSGALSNIVQIGIGNNNAAALGDDGHVYAWGWGYTVGRGKIDTAPLPNQVQLPDGSPLSGVVQISVGQNYTLALTQSGNVYGWGVNGSGQTGISDKSLGYAFYAYPVVIGSTQQILSDIVSISAGYNHGLALNSAGQVYAWGGNEYGQIGNGNVNQISNWASLVLSMNGKTTLNNIRAICAGGRFSLALDNSGQVLAWGIGTSGQLGLGFKSYSNQQLLPGYVVADSGIGKLQNVVALGVGNTSSYALTSDGSVLAWGSNYGSELGQNLSVSTLFNSGGPLKVKDSSGKASLSIGDMSDFRNLNQRYR